ncbi:MAG: helix-turn-helix domain-containing protein [Acidimicrobiales bacterium]
MSAATLRPNQREHILDVALRLMSEHGAAGTSMRALARECGINVAAIYHYFESKDALLAAVIEERRYEARLVEDIPDLSPDLPTATRLRAIYGTIWQGALAEESVWRLLLGEGLRGEPAALPVGASLLEVFRPGLASWIAAAVPEVAQPAAVADIMIGQLFAGFVQHTFDPAVPLADIEQRGADAICAVVAT